MHDNDDQHAAAGRTPDVVPLFLALFLLVLAFFILLVTISTFEEVKSKRVMDSLTSTFTTLLPPTADPSDFTANDGDVLAGQAFQEQVTGIFATTLQVAEITIVHPGRLMRIEIPAERLFFEDEARFRPVLTPLLDRIVATLSARPPGLRFDMEFVVGSPVGANGALPVEQTLEILRGGAFAREMAARGVPPDSIAVGILPGDPADVTIWFFVRAEDETRLQFTGQDAPPQP